MRPFKLLPLPKNLTLKYDTLITLIFCDEITLNLTSSIKKSRPIILDFPHIGPSKSLLHLQVPSVGDLFHDKYFQTYIIMYQSLSKAITNSILRPNAPLAYKALQHFITEDVVWIILEHILRIQDPYLNGKAWDLQKQIYYLHIIYSEDLAYFITKAAILHNNTILSRQYVSLNLLFEQVLTQIMACQVFPPFLGIKYSYFLRFWCQCVRQVLYDKDYIFSIYNYLETSKEPTALLTKTPCTNTLPPNIALFDFPILKSTQQTQDETTSPDNPTTVSWDTLSHQKLTIDPIVYSLKIQYCHTCKRSVTLQTPAVGVYYLLYHPSSVRTFNNTISSMGLHPSYL